MKKKNMIHEKLCYQSTNAAKTFSEKKKKDAFSFAEGYKMFLNESKTQ